MSWTKSMSRLLKWTSRRGFVYTSTLNGHKYRHWIFEERRYCLASMKSLFKYLLFLFIINSVMTIRHRSAGRQIQNSIAAWSWWSPICHQLLWAQNLISSAYSAWDYATIHVTSVIPVYYNRSQDELKGAGVTVLGAHKFHSAWDTLTSLHPDRYYLINTT